MFYRAAQSQCAIDHKVLIRFPKTHYLSKWMEKHVVIQGLEINNSLFVSSVIFFYVKLIGNICILFVHCQQPLHI